MMQLSEHAPKNWQPEHAPIGTKLVYATGYGEDAPQLTVEVTGHVQNGIDSWVFETDAQCPIFSDVPGARASANGSWIISILERGKGGIGLHKGHAACREAWVSSYEDRLKRGDVTPYKRKHEYAAYDVRTLIMTAIHANDTLYSYVGNNIHNFRFENQEFCDKFEDIIERKGPHGWVLTVSKRKLVKRLKQLLPRMKIKKSILIAEERAMYECSEIDDYSMFD